jgi:hypothetical protein
MESRGAHPEKMWSLSTWLLRIAYENIRIPEFKRRFSRRSETSSANPVFLILHRNGEQKHARCGSPDAWEFYEASEFLLFGIRAIELARSVFWPFRIEPKL